MKTYHIISLTKQGNPVSVCTTEALNPKGARQKTEKFCWAHDITVQDIVTDDEYKEQYGPSQLTWGQPTIRTQQDNRLFKLTWDTHTEYHKPHEMREKFAKTNLFDGDGVWVLTSPGASAHQPEWSSSALEDILTIIKPGEEWTCDNCTVTLDDSMFDKTGGANPPCRFCGCDDTNWNCDACTSVARKRGAAAHRLLFDKTVHRLHPVTIELVDDPGKYVKGLKTTGEKS